GRILPRNPRLGPGTRQGAPSLQRVRSRSEVAGLFARWPPARLRADRLDAAGLGRGAAGDHTGGQTRRRGPGEDVGRPWRGRCPARLPGSLEAGVLSRRGGRLVERPTPTG